LKLKPTAFLRFMVRNIVEALVKVGLGKISPDEFKRSLESRDRNQAGATAPVNGLFWNKVIY